MEVVYKFKRRLTIEIEQRDCKSPAGRFGGGWNWELGFQLGGHDLIINLLVFSIRFSVS